MVDLICLIGMLDHCNIFCFFRTLPRNLFESSEAGSMLCGTALVLGAAVATVTVDKIGRKVPKFYFKYISVLKF